LREINLKLIKRAQYSASATTARLLQYQNSIIYNF